MKRGAGASAFGYFWGNAKSDWPRAAIEREGGMRSWFDKLTTNGRMHRSNELLMRRIKPVVEGLQLGLWCRLAASIVTAGQEPREWQVASSHTGCRHSPGQEG